MPDDLAQRSKTHAPSLKRVLRLLASVDVSTEDSEGRFALTPIGGHLRAGVPGSMRAAALLFGGITQRAWGDLLYSVKTGEPAFAYFAQHPEEAANFDAAMISPHISIYQANCERTLIDQSLRIRYRASQ
jgi:hypothetical protein